MRRFRVYVLFEFDTGSVDTDGKAPGREEILEFDDDSANEVIRAECEYVLWAMTDSRSVKDSGWYEIYANTMPVNRGAVVCLSWQQGKARGQNHPGHMTGENHEEN